MSDSEIRDAWRSENYGRWRLLRDRASSDLLPIKHSYFPCWLSMYDNHFLALNPKHCWDTLCSLDDQRGMWAVIVHLATTRLTETGPVPADKLAELMQNLPNEYIRGGPFNVLGTRSGRMSGGSNARNEPGRRRNAIQDQTGAPYRMRRDHGR